MQAPVLEQNNSKRALVAVIALGGDNDTLPAGHAASSLLQPSVPTSTIFHVPGFKFIFVSFENIFFYLSIILS